MSSLQTFEALQAKEKELKQQLKETQQAMKAQRSNQGKKRKIDDEYADAERKAKEKYEAELQIAKDKKTKRLNALNNALNKKEKLATGWIIFQRAKRAEVEADITCTDKKERFSMVQKELSQMWKNTSGAEKANWNDMAKVQNNLLQQQNHQLVTYQSPARPVKVDDLDDVEEIEEIDVLLVE